jgi:hypothetical protein
MRHPRVGSLIVAGCPFLAASLIGPSVAAATTSPQLFAPDGQPYELFGSSASTSVPSSGTLRVRASHTVGAKYLCSAYRNLAAI